MSRLITIANPIYDRVFKYLLEDLDAAKCMLSTIIGKQIIDLQVDPRELYETGAIPGSQRTITIYQVDFAARVQLPDGSIELILIEIQKAKFASDIMRFRRYLGMHYSDQRYTYEVDGRRRAMSVVCIYFLGYALERLAASVVRVDRECIDMISGKRIEPEQREEFIEGLTHTTYVIQIPRLKGERHSEIEWLLTVFDQRHRREGNDHWLAFGEEEVVEAQRRYPSIWKRLQRALGEKELEGQMYLEDTYIGEIIDYQRGVERAEVKIREADERTAQADERTAQADERTRQAEAKTAQADERTRQAEERMQQTVRRLTHRGFSVEDIAETTGLSPEQVAHWME